MAVKSDFVVQLIYRSPLFNELGSRTSPMSFSGRNLRNKSAFNLPARIEKKELSGKEYDGYFEIGSLKQKGKITLEEASEKMIETIMLFDSGNFVNSIKNKKLAEIPLGIFSMANAQAMRDHINSLDDIRYPESDFVFPLAWAPEFYGDLMPDHDGYINSYNTGIEEYRFNIIGDPIENKYTNVPFLFVQFLLKKIYESQGYTLIGDKFLNHSEHSQLVVASNFSIDEKGRGYFARAKQPNVQSNVSKVYVDLRDDVDEECEDADDVFLNSSSAYKIEKEGTIALKFSATIYHLGGSTEPDPASPKLHVRFKLNGIQISQQSYIPTAMDFYPITHLHEFDADAGDVGKYVKVELEFTDNYGYPCAGHIYYSDFEGVNQTYSKMIIPSREINFKNHVPDISVAQFISDIEAVCGLKFIVNDNDKTVKAHYWIDILKSIAPVEFSHGIIAESKKVLHGERYTGFKFGYGNEQDFEGYRRIADVNSKYDLPSSALHNDIALVKNKNNFYRFQLPADGTDPYWEFFIENTFDFEQGDLKTNPYHIYVSCKPLPITKDYAAPDIIEIEEAGNSPALNTEKTDISFYLAYWRGKQASRPLATPLNIDSSGNTIEGCTHTLIPEDIVNSNYLPVKEWILNRMISVNYKKQITAKELSGLSYAKQYRVLGVDYLIGIVELGAKINRLTEANLKLYKV